MNIINILATNTDVFLTLVGLFSLVIGSFLNVVIYRLPIMLAQQKPSKTTTFNLISPRSHCPRCKKLIKFSHNIPLLSYILLRGKCANCHDKISARYPIVELITAITSIMVANHFGFTIQTAAFLLLTWGLIVLTFIDFKHLLLPDIITLPLLWIGLLLSTTGIFCSATTAIIGAVSGYLSLWIIAQLFKLVRGIEGMGYGDFKLLAVFGAWAGWQILPFIIFVASLLGALIGIIFIIIKKRPFSQPIPFGPYIAIAGWTGIIWNTNILNWYLHFVGFI